MIDLNKLKTAIKDLGWYCEQRLNDGRTLSPAMQMQPKTGVFSIMVSERPTVQIHSPENLMLHELSDLIRGLQVVEAFLVQQTPPVRP